MVGNEDFGYPTGLLWFHCMTNFSKHCLDFFCANHITNDVHLPPWFLQSERVLVRFVFGQELLKVLEPTLEVGLSYLMKMDAGLTDLVMDFHVGHVICRGELVLTIVLLQTLLN